MVYGVCNILIYLWDILYTLFQPSNLTIRRRTFDLLVSISVDSSKMEPTKI